MEEDDIGKLHDLDDRHLLHILAFEVGDYKPEAQYVLRAIQVERGITDADLAQYRLQCFHHWQRHTMCEHCHERLELEEADLAAGRFICPECGTEKLLSCPLEEFDDSEDAAEPEETADPAPTEEDTPADTAESGVACAYCDKELRSNEVRVVDGEFYCAECFGDEKRRVAAIEEPTDDRDDEIQRSVFTQWQYAPFLVIAVALVIIIMQLVNCLRDSQ